MATTVSPGAVDRARPDADVLARIERRVLWLATRIVDFANNERTQQDALKVGGHQASSASLVTLMTALYLHELRSRDRVSVKPHAAPVLHALEYLIGRLDRSYLKRLRDFGGLQAYPSRTKDPFPSTTQPGRWGSVRRRRYSERSPIATYQRDLASRAACRWFEATDPVGPDNAYLDASTIEFELAG